MSWEGATELCLVLNLTDTTHVQTLYNFIILVSIIRLGFDKHHKCFQIGRQCCGMCNHILVLLVFIYQCTKSCSRLFREKNIIFFTDKDTNLTAKKPLIIAH